MRFGWPGGSRLWRARWNPAGVGGRHSQRPQCAGLQFLPLADYINIQPIGAYAGPPGSEQQKLWEKTGRLADGTQPIWEEGNR